MKNTLVEICTIDEGIIDAVNFEEYAQLCDKYGITTSNVMPTSYWEPDAYERNVIGAVFSRATKLTDYKEQIPLQVLQELDKAKNRNLHDHYYVVSPVGSPDPLLIGSNKDGTWSLFTNPFSVIARWGTYLPTFEEMEKTAINLTSKRLDEYCMKLQMRLENLKKSQEESAKAVLHGMPPDAIYF